MINREIIRIKIVQLTYAYYQNGNKNIERTSTRLKKSCFSVSRKLMTSTTTCWHL